MMDDYVLHVPVERGIRAERRPFRIAIDAQPAAATADRVLTVWDETLSALLAQLTDRWCTGTSVDPYDGAVVLTVSPQPPHVRVRFDAPESTPDPMHLRSLAHLADGLRPAVRAEGPVSVYELDEMTARMVRRGADRFPLSATPDPHAASAGLARIRARFGHTSHAVAS